MANDADIARIEERETILAMLTKAASQRDCFHVGGDVLKNRAGTSLFIDASRIDAVIDDIRARGVLTGGEQMSYDLWKTRDPNDTGFYDMPEDNGPTELDTAYQRIEALVKALQDILTANVSFRASMPDDWEGDLLQDACDAARLVLKEASDGH